MKSPWKGLMSNPTLNRQFGKLPPTGSTADAGINTPPTPVVMGADDAMTIGGTASKTSFLLILVLAAGAWGWGLVEPELGPVSIPGWWFAVLIGAIAVAVVTAFRPQIAVFTGPVYAVGMGTVIGSISHIYDAQFEGIVLQALMATASVFLVMLVLFVTRTIRVTEKLRGIIIGATVGIMVFYLASIVLSLFGTSIPLVWEGGAVGIGFSLFIVAIAAFNLMLDFDLIERGVTARAPKHMEWFGAFALMVTIVWLYIEILRLISKIRD